MTMIHTDGLSVRIRRTLALDGVSLDLGTGVHGVLGPNGAGKSTLIRALATAVAPDEGSITLLNRDPAVLNQRLAIRQRLGYLPQEIGVYRQFSVREFLTYIAWLKRMPDAAIPAAVEEAVDRVGLSHRIDRKLRTLSVGMKQRIGIAQAIVNEPELLILDEPTSGLDVDHRESFHTMLWEMGQSACVVLATHQAEDVQETCSTATVLKRGKVAFHGSVTELTAAGGYSTVLRTGQRAATRLPPPRDP